MDTDALSPWPHTVYLQVAESVDEFLALAATKYSIKSYLQKQDWSYEKGQLRDRQSLLFCGHAEKVLMIHGTWSSYCVICQTMESSPASSSARISSRTRTAVWTAASKAALHAVAG